MCIEKLHTAAEAERLDDVVYDKSSTSFNPHHRRFTPDSGVEMTDLKSCSYFGDHAFEHSFHGFPSPVRTTTSLSASVNRSCSHGYRTQTTV